MEQHWEQLNESGNQIRRFEDMEEITMGFEEMKSLAHNFVLLEPRGKQPELRINVWAHTLIHVSHVFSRDYDGDDGNISDAGLYEVSIILSCNSSKS